jgi:methanogenic corrinoid protein MtbC1
MTARVRLLNPDGSLLLELGREESEEVIARAHEKGISPQDFIRQAINAGWASMIDRKGN